MTGLHSVCPNARDHLGLRERRRSSCAAGWSTPGAAPHEMRRSADRSRVGDARARATTAAHCAGTRKHADTARARAGRASRPGRTRPDGVITVVPPAQQRRQTARTARRCGTAARRTGRRRSPGASRGARSSLNACSSRLRWVSTAPLGRPVVPEVYMMNAGASSATARPRPVPARARPRAGRRSPRPASARRARPACGRPRHDRRERRRRRARRSRPQSAST